MLSNLQKPHIWCSKKEIAQIIFRAKIKSQSLTQVIETKQCPTLQTNIIKMKMETCRKIFEHLTQSLK